MCVYIYIYIYIYAGPQLPGGAPQGLLELQREPRGSQGMGVVGKNWFDSVLLSILYVFKPSLLTDVQTPFLGTPLVPLKG